MIGLSRAVGNQRTTCVAGLLAAAILFAGCADPTGEAGANPSARTPSAADSGHDPAAQLAYRRRADEVATAWKAAWPASRLHLLEGPVLSPRWGPDQPRLREAVAGGQLVLRVQLPDAPSRASVVVSGRTRTVRVISAESAFRALTAALPQAVISRPTSRASSPLTPARTAAQVPTIPDGRASDPQVVPPAPPVSPVPAVTADVVGASRQSGRVATDAGPADLPVWAFRVRGLRDPVRYVAVDPADLVRPPQVGPPGDVLPVVFYGASNARPVVSAPDRLAFDLTTGVCESNVRARVVEGDRWVIVGGTGLADVDSGRACPAIARQLPVEVSLSRPLGYRAVIDAVSGSPLTAPR